MPKEWNTWLKMWGKGAGNYFWKNPAAENPGNQNLASFNHYIKLFFSKQSLLSLLFVVEYTPLVV